MVLEKVNTETGEVNPNLIYSDDELDELSETDLEEEGREGEEEGEKKNN